MDVPLGMPAPHWPAPVPGRWHVVVPLGTTFQPWALSSLAAPAMLNGYGLAVALEGVNGLTGAAGTGP